MIFAKIKNAISWMSTKVARFNFAQKLKNQILASARAHAFGNSCEVVQNEVLEKLGFDLSALLMGLHGARSGIPQKIKTLTWLSKELPEKVQELLPEHAQDAANNSTGGYVVIVFMWDVLKSDIEKRHAAFVIPGEFTLCDGPAIGGGGLDLENIERGWALSNGRIHFTEWQKAHYFIYGYRKSV
jgi:hypothetical protein